MNGRAIPGAEMNTFGLTKISANECERIIFVSRGITVVGFKQLDNWEK